MGAKKIKFIEIRWNYKNEERGEELMIYLLNRLREEIWQAIPGARITYDLGNKQAHFEARDIL